MASAFLSFLLFSHISLVWSGLVWVWSGYGRSHGVSLFFQAGASQCKYHTARRTNLLESFVRLDGWSSQHS